MASQMLAGLTNAQSLQAEYPPATKHFLLIGFLGMFIGSVVFCFLSFKKQQNKMQVRACTCARMPPCACAHGFFAGSGACISRLEGQGQHAGRPDRTTALAWGHAQHLRSGGRGTGSRPHEATWKHSRIC